MVNDDNPPPRRSARLRGVAAPLEPPPPAPPKRKPNPKNAIVRVADDPPAAAVASASRCGNPQAPLQREATSELGPESDAGPSEIYISSDDEGEKKRKEKEEEKEGGQPPRVPFYVLHRTSKKSGAATFKLLLGPGESAKPTYMTTISTDDCHCSCEVVKDGSPDVCPHLRFVGERILAVPKAILNDLKSYSTRLKDETKTGRCVLCYLPAAAVDNDSPVLACEQADCSAAAHVSCITTLNTRTFTSLACPLCDKAEWPTLASPRPQEVPKRPIVTQASKAPVPKKKRRKPKKFSNYGVSSEERYWKWKTGTQNYKKVIREKFRNGEDLEERELDFIEDNGSETSDEGF